ncbi:hypothetical protein [Luteolibacter soli]|uniref:Uncharacterized protein n=1 Tax=Luteolibacter soli TaxID=3135280 RepID=A0ABU9AWC3_9BACT
MRWILTASAIAATSACLAADRPKPVNTDHLQVKYLFESDQPGLKPHPRYEIRSGKDFSTLLFSKARPEVQLRLHAIDASPDGRGVLIREQAAKGLQPFQWTLIYRSPTPADVPKVRELFQVLKQPGEETTERLIPNHLSIHRDAGGDDPAFFGDLKLIELKNDGLTFEDGAYKYQVRFKDCFDNFPAGQ